MGKDYDVELLGALPLDMAIREHGRLRQADRGRRRRMARVAEIYRSIARRVAVKIAEKAKDMSAKFPNIVVQNT